MKRIKIQSFEGFVDGIAGVFDVVTRPIADITTEQQLKRTQVGLGRSSLPGQVSIDTLSETPASQLVSQGLGVEHEGSGASLDPTGDVGKA